MDTIPVMPRGKLVANGTPCIVNGPNGREEAASLQERQPVLATWSKAEISVSSTGETEMVANARRPEFA